MKSIIGICTNFSIDDQVGIVTGLGTKKQDWDLLAHDYVQCVEKAGGAPLIIPVVDNIENLSSILRILDGIIFSGGSDISPEYYGEFPKFPSLGVDPIRDKHEIELANKALYEMEIPVLGICRGMQLLNVVSGGTMYQDLAEERKSDLFHSLEMYPKYYPAHEVVIKEESILHTIFKKSVMKVNSFHHQAVKKVGDGFEITMTSPDGLVEGLELQGKRFVVGVQFHPEMMVDNNPEYLALFKEFIKRCLKP